MKFNKAHCLFEQSGTFKKEFIRLGFKSYDYDILNDFNETDYIIDLFNEICFAYDEKKSIFDKFSSDDLIIAFFPCTRFENQISLSFRGEQLHDRNKSPLYFVERVIKLEQERADFYIIFAKLIAVCLRRNLRLIIENPFSQQHYLVRYFPIKCKLIDYDRTTRGDYFRKPTQYWFINCEPSYNIVMEPIPCYPNKTICRISSKVERSLISPFYANRFIREFIL